MMKKPDTYTVKLNGNLRAEGLSLPQACIYAEQLMEECGDNAAVVNLVREATKMMEVSEIE